MLMFVLVACRGGDERKAVPQAAVSSAAPAPDQLRPGELAEGDGNAFGLKLPRRLQIDATFPDAIFASGTVLPEDLVMFVRERVLAEGETKEGEKTLFVGATSKSAPSRKLRIEVVPRESKTELIVRDETRPPAKEGLSEQERWREHGLTPQGQPLDPTKLE